MRFRLSVCDGRFEMLVSDVLGECGHEYVSASLVKGVEEGVVVYADVFGELDVSVP